MGGREVNIPAAATARSGADSITLGLKGITKRFPGVLANDHIDLTVEPGEIHVLLGENGAGKTTLMNILYGLYQPDEGEILVNGVPVKFHSPSDAIRAGIGMVHQHFMLIPVFTVAENVMLGSELTRSFGFLDHRRARLEVQRLGQEFGLAVNPDTLVESLSVGAQQRVEIVKALYRQASVLILDEPTAVLTPSETEELLTVMQSLKRAGRSIVFITHKLRDAMQVADRITVLRGGRVVGATVPANSSEGELATMMVGHAIRLRVERPAAKPGAVVLSVAGLTAHDDRGQIAVDDVSFDVRAGEIVTIAGVQGNGQTELVRALMGLEPVVAGRIVVGGHDLTSASPRQTLDAGVGHVPEDRIKDGLIADFSIAENLALDVYYLPPYASGPILNPTEMVHNAEVRIPEFDIRTPSALTSVGTLSGGNQQRVVVAREFSRPVSLMIAAQPTRGLDVGSIEYIHERIVQLRDRGAAVLIVSSDLDEVLGMGDRIAVMFRGRMEGPFESEQLTRDEIGLMMAGATTGRNATSGGQPGGNL
ncbi:MAG TPA: ABC transporter ATP-binding protein [Candidatus Micrarchaeaceae archaeon]|nr:ABC transporter ATP-binding protein [Candidatus Micrarchaeaceae archaeon]